MRKITILLCTFLIFLVACTATQQPSQLPSTSEEQATKPTVSPEPPKTSDCESKLKFFQDEIKAKTSRYGELESSIHKTLLRLQQLKIENSTEVNKLEKDVKDMKDERQEIKAALPSLKDFLSRLPCYTGPPIQKEKPKNTTNTTNS